MGVADLAIAEYAGPIGVHDNAEIERNVEGGLIDRIVEALTRDASPARSSAAARAAPHAIACTGSLDEINRAFHAREWSDGLPIVPPTIERVERFVSHTSRAPDQTIAVLPSANLAATPWNIAANAVMAGCAPECMPLLVAAVEALADDRCSLANIGSSSGIVPWMLVGGPIAKSLGVHGGPQAISRGANPALGRALGLIVRNIAGFRPGGSYMGTFGYPLAFALGESDESPWPPLHVDHGYAAGASTVTIGVTNNWGASPAPYETADQSGALTALQLIAKEVTRKTRLFNFPAIGPEAEKVMVTVLVSPPVARALADAGYSRAGVQRWIYEHATMPLGDFDWVLRYTATMRTTARERAEAGVYPEEFAGAPTDLVRVLSSPDVVHVIVCGDPHRNRVMVMEGGHTQPTTREIGR
jgi:hypothetical protein